MNSFLTKVNLQSLKERFRGNRVRFDINKNFVENLTISIDETSVNKEVVVVRA